MAEERVGAEARLWIFGGYDGGFISLGGLYYFDTASSDWVQVTGALNVPAARERHALGWDPVHGRLVMFGGGQASFGSVTPLSEVQVYAPGSPGSWTLYTNSTPAPTPRVDVAMHWVASQGRFLVFGGMGGVDTTSPRYDELWWLELDPATSTANWTLISPSGPQPSPRNAACTGFDSVRDRLIVFGGEGAGAAALGGTFQYDLATNTWMQDTVTGDAPANRSFAACGWNANHRVLALYGGWNGTTALGGTYAYDPPTGEWRVYFPSADPGLLSDASATHSTALGGMFFFGGQTDTGTYVNETWLLTFWSVLPVTPTASAGADQTVSENALVTLDGSGVDSQGDPLTYQWTQSAGPLVTLSSTTDPRPTFTAPAVSQQTELRFELTVSDGVDTSPADEVVITVSDSLNEPPTADAGADQAVTASAQVTLSGQGSDPNAELLQFAWSQLSGTQVTLVANGADATFTAPASADTLTFVLTVTDARGGQATDSVTVTVAGGTVPGGEAPPLPGELLHLQVGCGCGTSAAPGHLALVFVLFLLLRRTRARRT